jgi:hypothetical protein
VSEGDLCPAIGCLLADDALRGRMSIAARAFARRDRFEARAAQLAAILQGQVSGR